MNHPVLSALLPVVLLIAIGFIAGKRQWVSAGSVKDLSNLVFLVLIPALLFRTMGAVHLEKLDLKPVGVYFLTVGIIFTGVLLWQGLSRRATVIALASIFSNTIMIGAPLVGLAYGEAALVYLFTLISLHALVLLTLATVVLEFAVMRERTQLVNTNTNTKTHTDSAASVVKNVLLAMRNAIIHPVPLPILAGLLFAQTGWTIPAVIDRPLQLLGSAFGPLALVLVGVTLAHTKVGAHIKGALAIVVVKNVLHPALMAALGWATGLSGMPLAVMVVAASLPVGANVFLFS
ncbi:MAG: AEC family transporter, partial [Burkholderiaceae bacterium]|nr:AEC family transporter [Burkholderiaceae bacterium]